MGDSGPRPTSIRIFLVDGVPDGLRIVEKSNWIGRAIVAGRSQVERALRRDELTQPGIYVLTGRGEDGTDRLYVGEADMLRERIKQHVSGKEFWTRFVAFISTNESLNKANVRYLEARLIGLAKSANQWAVDNSTAPLEPPLSEADRADAEWFLAEMLVIFPVLDIDAFESAAEEPLATGLETLLQLKRRGANASGREVADGFVVLKGSCARLEEVPSINEFLKDLRRGLQERGVLEPRGEHLVFTQDYRFSSPSAAAGAVVGSSANGREEWKDSSGRTLRQIQDARTAAVS